MRRRVAFACLVVTLGGAGAAAAQDVVAVATDSLAGAWFVPSDSPRTHVELVVRAGERDNAGAPGLAHYVEHLAWLSAVAPPGAARGDGGGADSNAATDLRVTRYWLDGPPEALDTMLARLARVLRPIALPEAFAREEIGIVRSEYELRFRDSPDASLWQDMDRLQHGEQWPAQSVIGTPESIASFTPEAAHAFQARTYRAGNTVLLVEGQHAEADVTRAVKAAFDTGADGAADDTDDTDGTDGTDAAGGAVSAPPVYRMPPSAALVERRVEPRLGAPELLHSRLVELEDPPGPDALAARRELLWSLLVSLRPGGLAAPLRYDAFVAESFDLGFSTIDERHLELQFEARPDSGVGLEALRGAFETALATTAREGFPQDSFERERTHLLDELDSLEKPALAVRDDAADSIVAGATPISLPAWRATLAAVTLDEVNALLRAFADAPRTVTLLVTPGTDR